MARKEAYYNIRKRKKHKKDKRKRRYPEESPFLGRQVKLAIEEAKELASAEEDKGKEIFLI